MFTFCNKIICVLLILVFSLFPASCFADGSSLEARDVINLVVAGESELSKPYELDKDGYIHLPWVEPVKLLGMNIIEATTAVTKALSDVLVSPEVTITYAGRAMMKIYVVGKVLKPGLVEIGVGGTVLQALAQVGYDDTADLSNISIRRNEQLIPINLAKYLSAEDLNQNIKLQSGDTVIVPPADAIGSILVVGQVNKTGNIPLKKNMTFKELMGLVGGVTVEADTERITIKREGIDQKLLIDYKRAMDGDPYADIVLMPNDTIHVPELETFYVTIYGAVNRPGQFPIKDNMSLREALGLAGGPAPNGDMRRVEIIRNVEKTGPINMKFDLTKMPENGSAEPTVQRGDVITVAARKEQKSFLETLGMILPFGWLFR
ncbi:MAG: SLBB domain-containing protein [Armatimonadota bacterium]